MTLYKITGPDRCACSCWAGQWPPPGEWYDQSNPLGFCEDFLFDFYREQDLVFWIVDDGEVWEADADGEIVAGTNKVNCLRARLTRLVGVLTHEVIRGLHADAIRLRCAIVRRRLARDWPGDGRPEAALVAAEAVAAALEVGGDVEAAWAARTARAAAWAAAEDAPVAAGYVVDAARAVGYAAGNAAGAASCAHEADAGAIAWEAAMISDRHDARGRIFRWLSARLLARLAGGMDEVDFVAVAAEVDP